MKVPINWLSQYVELPAEVPELTRQLTAIGHMQDKPPVEVGRDVVLDLEVRQNRSDCLSMIGVAREAAAILNRPLQLKPAEIELPTASEVAGVWIETEQCYRFHSLTIKGLKIEPSPEWLTQRLEAYGIKSINNVVDITNYVMVEWGEPLHAFDASKVVGQLRARQARAGETLTVLGNKTITLDPADIVIADDQQILALGGVIGGTAAAVTNKTTDIILEAATYNQANIRRTSLRHSLRTEASLRHEKFLHPELTVEALRRAASLLVELAGAKITAHGDSFPHPAAPVVVSLNIARMHQLNGLTIPTAEAVAILERLGIDVIEQTTDSLTVRVPYFRTDLVLEEDIYEEVLRIYGYDQVPDRLPSTPPPADITSALFVLEEELRDALVGFGWDEVITEPLTNEAVSVRPPVVLQNSLNADKTMLRTTLRYGLEQALAYHRKFRKPEIKLFEVGKVYFMVGDRQHEERWLAGVMAGSQTSFLTIKGAVETLLIKLGFRYDPELVSIMLGRDCWYFELPEERLAVAARDAQPLVRTTVPQVLFQDFSWLLPAATPVGEVLQAISSLDPLVYRVELGEPPRHVEAGKTVFIKVQYHQADGQITTEKAEPVRQQIVKLVAERWGGQLR